MKPDTLLYSYRIEGPAPYGNGTLLTAAHTLLEKRFLLKSLTPQLPVASSAYRDRF